MKLAAIYNVFDGEELLQGSIEQIRGTVDIIIAVVSNTSNNGRIKHEGGLNKVRELQALGLINDVLHYHPTANNNTRPGKHEINKRNQGLQLARQLGATHFISMDCDEYYKPNQFANMWKYIKSNPTIKATVCKMWTYFGLPTMRLSNPESYYVPFICKIEQNTKIGNYNCGYYCDPTRKPNTKAVHLDKIMMHHYSYVRKDLQSLDRKIKASSAFVNLKSKYFQLLDDWKEVVYNDAGISYKPCIYNESLIFDNNHFGIIEHGKAKEKA